METAAPARERRREPRSRLRVVHRHRIGTAIADRVSELLYVKGRPVALIDWIDLGGVRTPLYVCDLDPEKLRPAQAQRGVYHYEGLTADPRFPQMPIA